MDLLPYLDELAGYRFARNSHQPTAATAHLPHLAKAMWGRPESTALGSDKGLGVLSSTPAHFPSRAPSISVHLLALASRPGENCGQGVAIRVIWFQVRIVVRDW